MSSIAKEIEEAAALRQRIEEEREKGKEYGEAVNCVYYAVSHVGNSSYFPLVWIDYMDRVKELGIDDEKVARMYERLKERTDGKIFCGFASKEDAYEKAREKLINEIENASDEEKKVKAKEELEKFEKALDIISNATIQEIMYVCGNHTPDSEYKDDLKDFYDLACQKYSGALLNVYADKLRFYDEYISIIKFNKKLESMSDEEIKNLYISALNSNEQIEIIEKEIASLESKKEELNKQLEKKKREGEANLPSIEEIEKQIKTDEIQLKKVYDGLVFMGIDPEQNQNYITKKEELEKRKGIKDNPKQAVEFLPEITELKDKINEINEKLQNQNSIKESTIKEIAENKESIHNTSREEIENKLRQMSGLDFKALNLLENVDDEKYLSKFRYYLSDNSKDRAVNAIKEYLQFLEQNISNDEKKLNDSKTNIENIMARIEKQNDYIKRTDSRIEQIEEEQKKYDDLLSDAKLNVCSNRWMYITQDISSYENYANFTQEELETFNKILELDKAIREAEETHKADYKGGWDFDACCRRAAESMARYENNKARLENEKLSILEKHEIKQKIKNYEKEQSEKEDKYKDETIIQKEKEYKELKDSRDNALEKMRNLVNGYVQKKYPEVYRVGTPSIYVGSDYGGEPVLKIDEYYEEQRTKLGKELNRENVYKDNGCRELKNLNESLKASQEEIHKSEEVIEKLKRKKDRFITYIDRVETGGLFPGKEARMLYNQLNPDELDINSPTYESEFNQQLGIEEETTGKTR